MAGHDPPGDALASGIREALVQELGGVRAALALQVVPQPLARDPLELAEQVQLRFLAGVAPLGLQEPLGEVEDQSRGTHLLEMLETQVHPFADDPLVSRDGGSDQIGGELQGRVLVEGGGQPLLGQLDAVPLHARKSNLARIALRRDRLDLDRLARRLRRRGDHGTGREVERDAEHVGVFDVEHVLFVQVVGLPAQRPADHLLAQELGAERAHPEHMGDGAGIPALGQHRDGHHATGVAAESARLSDRVHDLAQQVLIGEVLGLPAVPGPLDDLTAEPLDLVAGRRSEVLVERLPGFELLAVDEQGAWPRQRIAVLVEIPEQREPALLQRRGAVLVLALEARDEVVDQLRCRGVDAHDDEARRDLDAGVLPQLEGAGVVAVERFKRGFELDRDTEGVERSGLSAALLRHLLPDVVPEVAERGHLAAGNVVRDRHPGELHDAALDGVHEREVAHRPGEEGSFRVAGPTQKERSRGQIDHAPDAELAPHCLQARDPYSCGLLVLLRLGSVVAFQRAFLVLLGRLLAVARLRQLGPLTDDNLLIFRDRTPKGRHYTERPGDPPTGLQDSSFGAGCFGNAKSS